MRNCAELSAVLKAATISLLIDWLTDWQKMNLQLLWSSNNIITFLKQKPKKNSNFSNVKINERTFNIFNSV